MVDGRTAWASVRAGGIGIVFQNVALLQTLSARENIEVALLGNLAGARRRRVRARELLAHFGLATRATSSRRIVPCLTGWSIVQALVFVFVAGPLGAFYPAWRPTRLLPAEALRRS